MIRGGAVDLAPLIAKDPTINENSFWPGPWNEVRWPQPDGKGIYGLPWDTVGSVLWCNNELLRNAGVDPPTSSWTWFDLRAAAKKVARIQTATVKTISGALSRLRRTRSMIRW